MRKSANYAFSATRRGFPPSVFSELPKLMERAGNSDKGSITALYTVLVEGDDMTEPVADETRSILDGHIILSRQLAEAGHYPAIDVTASVSRVITAITDEEHQRLNQRLFDELQNQDAVNYNDLMQWNAQVADLKQGLLDIEASIMKLEQERDRKKTEHTQARETKQNAQQQVIKFTELIREEQHEARKQQELAEDRELEDFHSPKISF